MICEIEFYSEAVFDENNTIQINDVLTEGEKLYISSGHEMVIENVIENQNKITIIDGNKILKLRII